MSAVERASRALARSAAYRQDADAKSTLKAYKSDYTHFKGWCQKNGFEARRPTPEIVAAYLAGCGEGYALSTLRRRVAAIRYFCDTPNYKLDTRARIVRETLRGIARNHGEPSRRAAALTIDEVRRLCDVCDNTLAGQRDRALFLVGFAGALRRSELVRIEVEDVEWNSTGMILLLTRSKTDREGRGVEISISTGTHEATCPVRALKQWIKAAGIRSGPVFRKIHSSGSLLKRQMTSDAVRQNSSQTGRYDGPERHTAAANQSARVKSGVRHHGLSERCARRGDHGTHPAPQLRSPCAAISAGRN